jgi:tetratricopeptide (TPR) repeat protein
VPRYYLAAQALDSASLMAKSLDRYEEAADLLVRASEMYTQHMAPDQTADALKRAGEVLVETNVERAIELYLRACEVFETEGREQMAGETFKATYAVLLRNKRCVRARGHRTERDDRPLTGGRREGAAWGAAGTMP